MTKKNVSVSVLFLYFESCLCKMFIYSILPYIKITFSRFPLETPCGLMSYTVGNCLRDNMSIFLYLFANVHIFSEICTNGRLIFISPRISSSSGTVLLG